MSGYSSYIASYKNGDRNIMISVVVYDGADPTHFESDGEYTEIYNANGIDYYIFYNNSYICAAWNQGYYDCCISGEISVDALKKMIDSIPKE